MVVLASAVVDTRSAITLLDPSISRLTEGSSVPKPTLPPSLMKKTDVSSSLKLTIGCDPF